MAGIIIALVIILGGGATIVASDKAVPGDSLYELDLAVEKAKINLASSEEKKDELRAKFEDERKIELETKAEGSANTRDVDLSDSSLTEIEVDVFTNETTVKLEANNHHYGFVTSKKTRASIVAEIAAKYNLTTAKVEAILDFETEDRASRADDKEFLNSSGSAEIKVEGVKEDRVKVKINTGVGLDFDDDDKGDDHGDDSDDDKDDDNSGHGGGDDDSDDEDNSGSGNW